MTLRHCRQDNANKYISNLVTYTIFYLYATNLSSAWMIVDTFSNPDADAFHLIPKFLKLPIAIEISSFVKKYAHFCLTAYRTMYVTHFNITLKEKIPVKIP